MKPLEKLEYFQKMNNQVLKLEFLKCKTRIRELRDELSREKDEFFAAQIQKKIDAEADTAKTIDDIWFFRNGEHIPFTDDE